MRPNGITFSVECHAVWAPGLESNEKWQAWCDDPFPVAQLPYADPPVAAMPAMLRRRAGTLGKMALEVAYRCLDGRPDIDTVFCSRHGDVARSLALLDDLVRGEPLSPTAFGMAVHNANAGLLSIARQDRAQHIALAGAAATFEHGLVEACGLLADGASRVLLVVADCALPELMQPFEPSPDFPFALAVMVVPPSSSPVALSWERQGANAGCGDAVPELAVPELAVPELAVPELALPELHAMRLLAGGADAHARVANGVTWRWSRHA